MNILIIGSGGREHALAWKFSQSEKVGKIFVAPGNAGSYNEEKVTNIDIKANEILMLLNFAQKNNIELTIVGSEDPLSLGIVDLFTANGLKCFGPQKECAKLESSKAFSKNFMKENNIPTAEYAEFNNSNSAKEYIKSKSLPIVIKASGLAAGKGVIIAQTQEEAFEAIDDMLTNNNFGEAGSIVVIEEFLYGKEASFIVVCDGKTAIPLTTSQDYKKLENNDEGPNTGGMGVISPSPIIDDIKHEKVMQTIINPTLKAMSEKGAPYVGFLYAGLMVLENGEIKNIEFNCRLGDPEAQAILMRMDSDIFDLSVDAINGNLKNKKLEWNNNMAVGVVLASKGYPKNYPKNEVIDGLNTDPTKDTKVFHAGTSMLNNEIVTNGGRVLCVVSLGKDLIEAKKLSYKTANNIKWLNKYNRCDIGD